MAGINRLAKFFADAAQCDECGIDIPEPSGEMFAVLEAAVGELIKLCRERGMDDKQTSHVFAKAIYMVAKGGSR